MPALVAGIPVLVMRQDVDGRDKFTLRPAFGRTGVPGHDETKSYPPVIGGKKAISRAPEMAASGFTCIRSMAARMTFGFSKA